MLEKLVTIEGKTEDHRYCETFLYGINQIIKEHSGKINQLFNPTNIQYDKHGSTKISVKSAFGEKFLKTCTSGCDYYLDCSIDKHKKYFNSSDIDLLCVLVNPLKNSVMKDEYNREKTRLTNLIYKQPEFCQRRLTDMLEFWDILKYRWAIAFKSNTHYFSQLSLAEAALASTKAGREKNVSLLDYRGHQI